MVLMNIPEEIEQKIKKESKHKWYDLSRNMSLPWNSEAQKVIKSKIKHYESTGNLRKLDIYKRKLAHNNYLISKIKDLFKKND